MSQYVYIESEHEKEFSLYTVGYYDFKDNWHPESDYNNKEDAARRVQYLNGSNCNQDRNCNQENIDELIKCLENSTDCLDVILNTVHKKQPIVIPALLSNQIYENRRVLKRARKE
jgi:hypothetical protein